MEELDKIKRRYGIIGNSNALENALKTAVRVANTDLTVLITGESGVGKEVFSQIIHNLSPRKHNNFIAINCGAIPEGTINSELFGHEKGAFTGASGERKGYFETVDGGTIFLDEIGEMPLDTQSFLLRILESGEFIRVGSSKIIKTDVRVIAATNVNLEGKIKEGKFREDLYYRLNTVPIQIPPLRKRKEDIFLLFRKFCVDFAEKYKIAPVQLDNESRIILENYQWPGNIRELKNMAEQLSILSEKRNLGTEDLQSIAPHLIAKNLPTKLEYFETNESMREREILYKLLFEMKSDLTDLKALVFELIQNNNLSVSDNAALRQLASGNYDAANFNKVNREFKDYYSNEENTNLPIDKTPLIIHKQDEEVEDLEQFDESEIVEEILSLENMEKILINKALKKHGGRRKDASDELGISERTLYRKIKQYNLDN